MTAQNCACVHLPPPRKHRPGKEKLQISAHFWYKVSRSERVSYNGITPASQADNEGSIPFTRSTSFESLVRPCRRGMQKQKNRSLSDRFFYGRFMGALSTHCHDKRARKWQRPRAVLQRLERVRSSSRRTYSAHRVFLPILNEIGLVSISADIAVQEGSCNTAGVLIRHLPNAIFLHFSLQSAPANDRRAGKVLITFIW